MATEFGDGFWAMIGAAITAAFGYLGLRAKSRIDQNVASQQKKPKRFELFKNALNGLVAYDPHIIVVSAAIIPEKDIIQTMQIFESSDDQTFDIYRTPFEMEMRLRKAVAEVSVHGASEFRAEDLELQSTRDWFEQYGVERVFLFSLGYHSVSIKDTSYEGHFILLVNRTLDADPPPLFFNACRACAGQLVGILKRLSGR